MAATSCAQAPQGSQDYLGRKPTVIPVSGSGTVPRSPGRGLRHSEVEEVDCSVEDRDVEPGSAVTLPDVPATCHGVLPVPVGFSHRCPGSSVPQPGWWSQGPKPTSRKHSCLPAALTRVSGLRTTCTGQSPQGLGLGHWCLTRGDIWQWLEYF